jgi:hypothetical protein
VAAAKWRKTTTKFKIIIYKRKATLTGGLGRRKVTRH